MTPFYIVAISPQLEMTFLKAYSTSNRLFPQTRCYFIVEFSSRLSGEELAEVMVRPIEPSEPKLRRLANMANRLHAERRILKRVDVAGIRTDICKMLEAQKAVFASFARQIGTPTAHASFIKACTDMRQAVKEVDLSPGYLKFLAPPKPIGEHEAMTRSENFYLTRRWPRAVGDDVSLALLQALRPEIDRAVWVLRPAGANV